MSAATPCLLVPRTPTSFTVNNVPGLAGWLQRRGYQALSARSIVEFGRYQRGQSLIVLYHSGTTVLQGGDTATARALLAQLVPAPIDEPEQLSLLEGCC